MSARRCFTGKMARGKVSARAGQQILDMLDGFERDHQAQLGDGAAARQAALDAAEAAKFAAIRRADLARRQLVAQADVLRAKAATETTLATLRAQKQAPLLLKNPDSSPLFTAMRSLLALDPWDMAPTWNNVHYLARDIRGRAHARIAAAIAALKPTRLGLVRQTVRELDLLRAFHGDPRAPADMRGHVEAIGAAFEELRLQFVAAGGALAKRENYFPNPTLDPAKVKALGAERFKALVRQHVDRAAMIDFDTGMPMTDARFEDLLNQVTNGYLRDFAPQPTAAVAGRRMLANRRDAARFFAWKDADSWSAIADNLAVNPSPFDAVVNHIAGLADDIALMRIMGPNPEATKRFILGLFDREAGRLAVAAEPGEGGLKKAVRRNRKIAAQVDTGRRRFEALWDEVTGANRVPVNMELARRMADARSWLVASQMGSALISSLTDPALLTVQARSIGLPAFQVIARAAAMMGQKGAEVHAAQLGLVADTMAHTLGEADRVMGETIRTGTVGKLGSVVIRAQGLRRWTAVLRSAFGMEMMAHAAREAGKPFAGLDASFRATLERYGIAAADWERMRAAPLYEPRPNATFLRPMDIAATPADRALSEKWARLINTEMDFAVIDQDPGVRAALLGQSRPGTLGGEVRRGATMYRSFAATFMALHFSKAIARGWNGSRLSHAALTFLAMTAMGSLAMQSREILQGRDPLDLTDPRSWGKAVLQGGGLGIFGDLFFLDQTRYGNTWAATGAGAMFSAAEAVLGDFLIKNLQLAANGKPTHFFGDAVYVAGRYIPGSSLWFARLAWQRAVVDQAALLVDARTPERFRRIERTAAKHWGQEFWLPPGQMLPARAPDLSAMGGTP